MTNEEPKIIDGKIRHDIMAQYLMSKYTFRTFKDTEEILIFDRQKGYYTKYSLSTIKRVVNKTLK
jgi:hypothetical protein